jgi:hypothetical protein
VTTRARPHAGSRGGRRTACDVIGRAAKDVTPAGARTFRWSAGCAAAFRRKQKRGESGSRVSGRLVSVHPGRLTLDWRDAHNHARGGTRRVGGLTPRPMRAGRRPMFWTGKVTASTANRLRVCRSGSPGTIQSPRAGRRSGRGTQPPRVWQPHPATSKAGSLRDALTAAQPVRPSTPVGGSLLPRGEQSRRLGWRHRRSCRPRRWTCRPPGKQTTAVPAVPTRRHVSPAPGPVDGPPAPARTSVA